MLWIRVERGRLRSGPGTLDDVDATIEFDDEELLFQFATPRGARDLLSWMSHQQARVKGQCTCLAKLLQISRAVHVGTQPGKRRGRWPSDPPEDGELEILLRCGAPKPFGAPSGARWLPEPAMASRSLEDFPRLKRSLRRLLGARPHISIERAVALTEVVAGSVGEGKVPSVLARARWVRHVLLEKAAVVRDDDLVLGTTTEHLLGVPVYPELSHLLLWSELPDLELREAMPIRLSSGDWDRLNQEIFPFWMGRNVVDVASGYAGRSSLIGWLAGARPFHLGDQDGAWATVPDYGSVLNRGLQAIAEQAREASSMALPEQAAYHQSVSIVIEGVLDYATRLAQRAELEARGTGDPARRQELLEAALSCRRCPARPAETLLDALNAIRIVVASLHQEIMNDGLSLGRLDVLLQPYLARELERARSDAAREGVLKRSVELVGCFLLSLADHVPLVAGSIARMRAGCRSRQAVTVGGLLSDGSSAVCEMTYVILKASEMLGLPDPRVHVRYHPRTTPDYLLRRACEVACGTGAGPSVHNDEVVIKVLETLGFSSQRARDWAVTGAVTPTVVGEHFPHPFAITLDLTSALEMALNDGEHPTLSGVIGPSTGSAETYVSMTEVIEAIEAQLDALLDLAMDGCASIQLALQAVTPTPLLSSLILGTHEEGVDITRGGARHDHGCVNIVGYSEVVDSLCAIDELVFVRKELSMAKMMSAVAEDFLGTPTLYETLRADVSRYGDGSDRVLTTAQRVLAMVHHVLRRHQRHRGRWVAAYGGQAHVGFGRDASALPNGRRVGEFFTPGICPSVHGDASASQRISHGSSLRSRYMQGGSLFEAIVPGTGLEPVEHVEHALVHARAFLERGGMHIQLVTTDATELFRAGEDPVVYRDTLVSIGGCDAYFGELPSELREHLVRGARSASG